MAEELVRVASEKLSGRSYVAARMKGEHRFTKIKIAGVRIPCDHMQRICPACMLDWCDYQLFPLHTQGGKRLLLEREQLGLDNSKWTE